MKTIRTSINGAEQKCKVRKDYFASGNISLTLVDEETGAEVLELLADSEETNDVRLASLSNVEREEALRIIEQYELGTKTSFFVKDTYTKQEHLLIWLFPEMIQEFEPTLMFA